MRNRFLAQALGAKGSLGGAIGITWASFLMLGGIPLMGAIFVAFLIDPVAVKAYLDDPFNFALLGFPRMIFFILLMLNFVIAMAGLWAGAKYISEQRFITLVTAMERVRWGRMAAGMGIWMLLLGVYSFIQYLISPASFVLSDDAAEVPLWLLPGLLLIPIQSSFEEIALRGQLMQGIAKMRPRKPWVPLLTTSIVFALLHGFNAEVSTYGFFTMMLQYFIFGLFLGTFALMDEGLELAIGIHVGNNLFSMFFLSYEGASIDTPSIWAQTSITPTNDLFGVLLMFMLVFILFFGSRPHLLKRIWTTEPDEQEPGL